MPMKLTALLEGASPAFEWQINGAVRRFGKRSRRSPCRLVAASPALRPPFLELASAGPLPKPSLGLQNLFRENSSSDWSWRGGRVGLEIRRKLHDVAPRLRI